MENARSHTDCFAQARLEKRLIFQQSWNSFIQSPVLLAALIALTFAQGMLTVFYGSFLYEQAVYFGIIGSEPPVWCWLIIALLQLILSLPGWGIVAGLWRIRTKTRWHGDAITDISGVKLIKLFNTILTTFTGVTLAMYPTIIITAGEYLQEEPLFRLFYLLLSSSALFLLCVTFVRIVIRTAEENITCCWAEAKFLLPLIVTLLAVVAAVFLFAPLFKLFYIAVALLSAAFSFLLILYWHFLRKVALQGAKIDRQAISSREDTNDPYSRY